MGETEMTNPYAKFADAERKAEIVKAVRETVSIAVAEVLHQAFAEGYSITDMREKLTAARNATTE